MSIYLKFTMDAFQTIIVTNTTDISNGAIKRTTCGIRNQIHRLIHNQTIGNESNEYMYEIIKKLVDVEQIGPSPNIYLPPVARLASAVGCVVLEAFTIFVNITNRQHPII